MDLEQRLRASLVAPDPGPTFTARVMARVGRGAVRRRGSFILIGTVLVVGAAAAMLAWQMSAIQPPPVESAAISTVSDPGPAADEPVVQAIVGTSKSEESTPDPAPPRDGSPRYSVLVMPLRHDVQDVTKRRPVEALYAAMLDELRKVPGLTLHTPGDSERGDGAGADHVLTITSLATRVTQSGGIVVRSADGTTDTVYNYMDRIVATSRNDGSGGTLAVTRGAVSNSNDGGSGNSETASWVEIRAEPWQSAASRHDLPVGVGGATATYGSGTMSGVANLVLNNRLSGFNVDVDYGPNEAGDGAGPPSAPALPAVPPVEVLRVQVFPPEAASRERCASPNAVRPSECLTPAQLAATLVEILRLKVFPPDAALQQRLLARLGDISVDPAVGLAAMRDLQDLLQGLTDDGGSRLDAGTIHALVRYVAGQPAGPRQYVWNALRQVSHPALVAPLVESLRHDADQQVRLAALTNLEANYSTDPVVRGALDRIGREDPDGVVRVAVRRVLYGQAQWRDEVLAALQNTAASYEARLAPLLASGPVVSPRQQGHRRAALREQQVLRPLTILIRERLQDADHAKATSDVLGLLASVDDPAVFDLFMQVIRETPVLKQETSVRGSSISMSGPVSSWVFNHRTDPRVLESVTDVDPRLRTMMEQTRDSATYPAAAVPVGPPPPAMYELPSNLVERMREVIRNPGSTAPVMQ